MFFAGPSLVDLTWTANADRSIASQTTSDLYAKTRQTAMGFKNLTFLLCAFILQPLKSRSEWFA